MIEVPVNDHRKILPLPDLFRIHLVGFCLQLMLCGSLDNIFCQASIPRHIAVNPHFLQGNKPLIIRQYHCQRCRAALNGFHLQHHRHSLYIFHCFPLLYFLKDQLIRMIFLPYDPDPATVAGFHVQRLALRIRPDIASISRLLHTELNGYLHTIL